MNFRDDATRPKALAMFSHSSLTDIVLLLLIFFLLTSSFVTNFGIKVEIPKADAGAPPDGRVLEVAVTKDGKYYVNGRETPRTELAARIQEENTKNPQETLVLRGDRDATFQNTVEVMNIGQLLRLRVLIAVEQE